jgi:hypothetical protein
MQERGKNLPAMNVVRATQLGQLSYGKSVQANLSEKYQWKSDAKNPPIFLKNPRGG